jgi:uroporphyrinogen-III synthase
MAAKTIAVTRPRAEKDALTWLLQDRGYHAIHEPLTHIVLRADAQDSLQQALAAHPDAVIVTSRQGVRGLATLTELRDIVLICVGQATAHAAEANGFTRVYAAGGNAALLIEYILTSFDPESRLVYVSAEHVRVDIATVLSKQGMHVERVVVYEAIAAEQFTDIFAQNLQRGHIDAVTFLSQRAAEVFCNLAASAKLISALRIVHACVLSKSIAESLNAKQWRRVHIARTPTLVALGNCVDKAFTKRKKA